jgi:hypothetical protein
MTTHSAFTICCVMQGTVSSQAVQRPVKETEMSLVQAGWHPTYLPHTPVNFQSVIDSPERVRRVKPPSTTMLNTHALQPPTHQASCRRAESDKPCDSARLGLLLTAFKALAGNTSAAAQRHASTISVLLVSGLSKQALAAAQHVDEARPYQGPCRICLLALAQLSTLLRVICCVSAVQQRCWGPPLHPVRQSQHFQVTLSHRPGHVRATRPYLRRSPACCCCCSIRSCCRH